MKHWYFEREMSVGELSDLVTTINVPVVGSAEFARGNFFMEWGISDMLANLEAHVFVRKSVGELLFEGYKDEVMTIASDMNNEADSYSDYSYSDYSYDYSDSDFNFDNDIEAEEDRPRRQVEGDGDVQKMDKFGWFYDVSESLLNASG